MSISAKALEARWRVTSRCRDMHSKRSRNQLDKVDVALDAAVRRMVRARGVETNHPGKAEIHRAPSSSLHARKDAGGGTACESPTRITSIRAPSQCEVGAPHEAPPRTTLAT